MALTFKLVVVFFTLFVYGKCKDYIAKTKQFPFIAALEITIGNNKVHCTGSIIAPSWVLTAAVCYRDDDQHVHETGTKVRAGTVDYQVKTEHTQDRTSLRHIVHDYNPKRDKSDANFDVALVEVNAPFKLTEYVNFIHIAMHFPGNILERLYLYPICTSVSFRFSFSHGINSTVLETGNTSKLYFVGSGAGESNICKEYRDDLKWDSEHLCVFARAHNESVCRAEAGSPIIAAGALVGTLSGDKRVANTMKCPYENFLVYMHTIYFESWIRQHVPGLPELRNLPLSLQDASRKWSWSDLFTGRRRRRRHGWGRGRRGTSSIFTCVASMSALVVYNSMSL